jgi:hypothetical protein
MDFGIEAVTRYPRIMHYGRLWVVEFRDYTQALVIEDPIDSPEANYILVPESYSD